MFVCTKCLISKPQSAFRYRRDKDRYEKRCLDCERAVRNGYARKRRATPEYKAQRRVGHLARYNLTETEYQELLDSQDNRCAICRQGFGDSRPTIDHDHNCCPERASSCGWCIRGLLCNPCNMTLGMFEGSVGITAFLAYILRGPVTTTPKEQIDVGEVSLEEMRAAKRWALDRGMITTRFGDPSRVIIARYREAMARAEA